MERFRVFASVELSTVISQPKGSNPSFDEMQNIPATADVDCSEASRSAEMLKIWSTNRILSSSLWSTSRTSDGELLPNMAEARQKLPIFQWCPLRFHRSQSFPSESICPAKAPSLPLRHSITRVFTMYCSISGKVAEDPVVSKKSGLLFEKRLIEKHIADFGKCPITGQPLTLDDLVPVKPAKISATLAPVESIEEYTQISSHPFHKTNKPGIISLDILYSKDLIATGGIDTNAVIFDKPSGQILSALRGHSEKVTSVKFAAQGKVLLTGSADKTVRVWQGSDDGNYNCKHILRDHTAEVEAVTVNKTNKYFVTASLDGTWCLYDLSSGTCLTQALQVLPKAIRLQLLMGAFLELARQMLLLISGT
ncbi:hypothetical protein PIB30_058491 [Stylosanthes scabra]|uniref:Pre-mRNA-processing factor 19 n=1 Tax=Stylosanthes scabra TaxID=79078 RepID=A0ABU6SLB5_9FABA|nr:hypothetical protein [Stylosanthes scabra]